MMMDEATDKVGRMGKALRQGETARLALALHAMRAAAAAEPDQTELDALKQKVRQLEANNEHLRRQVMELPVSRSMGGWPVDLVLPRHARTMVMQELVLDVPRGASQRKECSMQQEDKCSKPPGEPMATFVPERIRIYVAAPWQRRSAAASVAKMLGEAGHRIVSTWHEGPAEDEALIDLPDPDDEDGLVPRDWAARDIEQIKACDYLVLISPATGGESRGGHLVELGVALALGTPVLAVGHWPRPTVFHRHALVHHFADVFEMMDRLRSVADARAEVAGRERLRQQPAADGEEVSP